MASSVARWDDEAQQLQPLQPPPPAGAGDQGRGARWPADPAGAERIIEDEVRELVRRSAMDPAGDTVAAVRSLIDDVVADYAERTLTASMPALVEPAAVAKAVADRVIGLGPLQEYFDDPEVEEIWINQPDKVFVARAGRPILTGTVLTEEQVHDLVELMLRASASRARERLVTCEEVFELRIDLPDVVAMQTRQPNLEGQGEIRQRRLVKEALRMRPNRLIVGEVRQEEALDLLIALNSGIAGMTSLHANSAREALDKLTTLPLLAGENISHRFIVPAVAAAIDLIVFMRCGGDGRRRVEEVLAVPGRVAGGEIESQSLFCQVAGELLWTGHYPPHEERFLAAGIDLGEVLCA